jgi:hypothetical protein
MMNSRVRSRNSKQKNEDWTLKCWEMSDWKTKVLNGDKKCQEMSEEELYKLSYKDLKNEQLRYWVSAKKWVTEIMRDLRKCDELRKLYWK